MESNVEEALRYKALAEKHFMEKDYVGANSYALRAQRLCPEMEGISQMVATFAVYIASEAKIDDELDFYSILGLDPSAEKSKLKKHYKKMAVLLHPDKNKTVGADGAFRLVSEAWSLLSDSKKRSSYDHKRNQFAGYTAGSGYENYPKYPPTQVRSDTFWTVCTSCHVQYEYLRKYVSKRLSCKNCRGVFIAHETGLAPVNGSFPYCTTYSYGPDTTYGGHGRGVTYVPPTSGFHTPNGTSGRHKGRRTEYASNISFQNNPTGNPAGVVDPNGLSSSSFVFYQANGDANKTKPDGESNKLKASGDKGSNGYNDAASKPKRGRPSKKRKVDVVSLNVNGHESSQNAVAEAKKAYANGAVQPASKLSSPSEASARRWSAAPQFDTRHFLLIKAKSEISTKLAEMKLAAEAKEAEKRKATEVVKLSEAVVKVPTATGGARNLPELKRTVSMSITVPDSDFHDFDKDRSEECFQAKQIWAMYDEEDGMPRLYCLIREVISVNPFKIFISYLSSRSDSEFGSVNWLDSGFTKSCGSFRVFHSETVEQVNIFSHLLSREKAGRGGCVRIYPRKGDIWAVYRNWSADWNRTTPDEVRHRYEMVEVIADYSEEKGVWVTPLVKLDGFKTVYQKKANSNAVRWIPKREMLRFSHQVPSCSLQGEGTNLPDGCWDLDPAATPDELLQRENEIQNSESPVQAQETTSAAEQQHQSEPKAESEERLGQGETFKSASLPAVKETSEGEPPSLDVDLNMDRAPVEIPEGRNDDETFSSTPSPAVKPPSEGETPSLDVDLNMDRAPVEIPEGINDGETFSSTPSPAAKAPSEGEPPSLYVDLNMDRAPVEIREGRTNAETFSSTPSFTLGSCTQGVPPYLDVDLNMARTDVELPGERSEAKTFRPAPSFAIQQCLDVDLNMERIPMELSEGVSQSVMFGSEPFFNNKTYTQGRPCLEVDLNMERPPAELQNETFRSAPTFTAKPCAEGRTSMDMDLDLERIPVEFPGGFDMEVPPGGFDMEVAPGGFDMEVTPEVQHTEHMFDFKWC